MADDKYIGRILEKKIDETRPNSNGVVFHIEKINNIIVAFNTDQNNSRKDSLWYSLDDGETWEKNTIISDAWDLKKIEYADCINKFLMITHQNSSYEGKIYCSEDGINWETYTAPFTSYNYITKIENKLFAATDAGLYISQDDGETWGSPVTSTVYNYITKIENKLFATNDSTYKTYVSQDSGETWKLACNINIDFDSEFFHINENIFGYYSYKVNNMKGYYYSEDGGITWEKTTNFKNYNDCSSEGYFEKGDVISVLTNGYVFVSQDRGKTWTSTSLTSNYYKPYKIVSENNVCIAYGRNAKEMYYSVDGINWGQCSGFEVDNVNGGYLLAYNNGVWLAAHQYTNGQELCYSINGQNWTRFYNASSYQYNDYFELLYNNGIWVCSVNKSKLFTSNNKTNWEQVTEVNNIDSVVCFKNKWFYSTYIVTKVSNDGISWEDIGPKSELTVYETENGKALYGSKGYVTYDGKNWFETKSLNNINKKGKYFIGKEGDYCYYCSKDLKEWAKIIDCQKMGFSIEYYLFDKTIILASSFNLDNKQYSLYISKEKEYEVKDFTLDNFKFPKIAGLTNRSEHYGFGTDSDGVIVYNELMDNLTTPIINKKAKTITEDTKIRKAEYDLKLLVSNGKGIVLPENKEGLSITIIPEGTAYIHKDELYKTIEEEKTFICNGISWKEEAGLKEITGLEQEDWFEKIFGPRLGENWKTIQNEYKCLWTPSNITNTNFNSVAYANGKWVAAGGKGLYYSTNGQNWTQSNITSGGFFSVTYGGDLWVAGSSKHGLYYSTNGEEWTQSNKTGDSFKAVAYGDGTWVAGDDDWSGDGLYYSTNGQSWTQSNATYGGYYSVVYASGIWVAGTNYGSGLEYSTDGQHWTQSDITSGSFYSVAYANGLWVAGSYNNKGLYYSTNGQNWTQSDITSGRFYSVAYGDGKWVAGSDSYDNKGLYYSEDGQNWTQSNITSGNFNSVAYANGKWVAAGGNGLYYSEDGQNWTQSDITSGRFYSAVYGDGTWVVGGNSGLYYSTDTNDFYSVCEEKNGYVIAGDKGLWHLGKEEDLVLIKAGKFTSVAANGKDFVASSGNDTGLWYSTDGQNWKQSNKTSGIFDNIIYNQDKKIFIAYGKIDSIGGTSVGIWYGSIASHWQAASISTNKIYDIACGKNDFGDDLFVAGSSNYGLYYSTNGQNWNQSNIESGSFYSIAYGIGIWVAGSDHGLYFSKGGRDNWTQSNKRSGMFRSVAYGCNLWVAGSESNYGLYYSTDGEEWDQSNITSGNFKSIAYANGKWVAGGDQGLYYSTDGRNWVKSTEGNMTQNISYLKNKWFNLGSNIMISGIEQLGLKD